MKNPIQQINRNLGVQQYAASTKKQYLCAFKSFYHSEFYQEPLTKACVIDYLLHLTEKNYSHSQLNSVINSIKFYREKVLGAEKEYYTIPRPRTKKTLPVILNKQEIAHLFAQIKNRKHLILLKLIYACGLRIGETLSIEIKDIDGVRKRLHIHQGKGNKDRYVPLPDSLLAELRIYYQEFRPKKYLFEGLPANMDDPIPPYSQSSARQIFRRALKRAGISKKVKLHGLRHAYATHMLEHGVDLRYIQTLLGHNSSKTTEIYTHVSTRKLDSLPSPIDFL